MHYAAAMSWYGVSFAGLCRQGLLPLVREELALPAPDDVAVHDIHAGFVAACAAGALDVVRELLALTGGRTVRVQFMCNEAFVRACEHGRVDVVRELLALRDGRTARDVEWNDCGFQAACARGHLDVVRLLLQQPADDMPGHFNQALYGTACLGALEAFTGNVCAWRACTVHVQSLCPPLRSQVAARVQHTLWKHRARLVCARHARAPRPTRNE